MKINTQDEWINMPEFVQEKKEPFKKINIRFETEEERRINAQSNEIINRLANTASNSFMLLAVFIEYQGKHD